jgi:hypothetical protein
MIWKMVHELLQIVKSSANYLHTENGETAMFKNGDKIEKDGDTWVILSLGVELDGKRYAHLASTTRFRQQRNGKVPVQQCDWIE